MIVCVCVCVVCVCVLCVVCLRRCFVSQVVGATVTIGGAPFTITGQSRSFVESIVFSGTGSLHLGLGPSIYAYVKMVSDVRDRVFVVVRSLQKIANFVKSAIDLMNCCRHTYTRCGKAGRSHHSATSSFDLNQPNLEANSKNLYTHTVLSAAFVVWQWSSSCTPLHVINSQGCSEAEAGSSNRVENKQKAARRRKTAPSQ